MTSSRGCQTGQKERKREKRYYGLRYAWDLVHSHERGGGEKCRADLIDVHGKRGKEGSGKTGEVHTSISSRNDNEKGRWHRLWSLLSRR